MCNKLFCRKSLQIYKHPQRNSNVNAAIVLFLIASSIITEQFQKWNDELECILGCLIYLVFVCSLSSLGVCKTGSRGTGCLSSLDVDLIV